MRKTRKPAKVNYKHLIRELPLIEVFEEYYAEEFAEPEDILAKRTPVLFDDIYLFEDISYAQQVEFSRKIAKFLTDYANWIETRKQSEDPNGK